MGKCEPLSEHDTDPCRVVGLTALMSTAVSRPRCGAKCKQAEEAQKNGLKIYTNNLII